jgi:hypothetical protein
MRVALAILGGLTVLSLIGVACGRLLRRRDPEAWRRLDPRGRMWTWPEEPTRLDRLRAIARAAQDEREQ